MQKCVSVRSYVKMRSYENINKRTNAEVIVFHFKEKLLPFVKTLVFMQQTLTITDHQPWTMSMVYMHF